MSFGHCLGHRLRDADGFVSDGSSVVRELEARHLEVGVHSCGACVFPGGACCDFPGIPGFRAVAVLPRAVGLRPARLGEMRAEECGLGEMAWMPAADLESRAGRLDRHLAPGQFGEALRPLELQIFQRKLPLPLFLLGMVGLVWSILLALGALQMGANLQAGLLRSLTQGRLFLRLS